MKFYSTRNKDRLTNFRSAVFSGLAPDGGLYMPAETPQLCDMINSFPEDASFVEIATAVTAEILGEELDRDASERICRAAFGFEPRLVRLDGQTSILELFHGPSCAFKDYGASFLAASMEELLRTESGKAVILTATSGDTGSAVAQAFHGREHIEVVILYPSGRVSPLQEKQLTTLGGNIKALEVKGSFDDCQRMVKEAFLDRALAERLHLTSANSISLGRLIPQSFYYIWAWTRMKQNRDDLWFSVPSGNFGNLTAGILGHSWGMGNSGFIASTNANDVVPEYLRTANFTPRPSVQTLSNAMDVGNPSNFERMLDIFAGSRDRMQEIVREEVVTDAETKTVMGEVLANHGYEMDPHTAVGYLGAKRFLDRNRSGSGRQAVCLSTAHPGKFTEVFLEATGKKPFLPQRLERVLELPKESVIIGNDIDSLKEFLEASY